MNAPEEFYQSQRWLSCRNVDSIDLSPYQGLEVTGCYADGTLKVVAARAPVLLINQTTSVTVVWNGTLAMAPNAFGFCTRDLPAWGETTAGGGYTEIRARGE